MNEKSHVSLERRVCIVCGSEYETGTILLDRRLRASLEHHTTTGWGLCSQHRQLFDEGFIALIECDPQRSGAPSSDNLVKPDQVFRTGKVAHLKREAFGRIFDAVLKPDQACVFVEPGVIDNVQGMVQPRH